MVTQNLLTQHGLKVISWLFGWRFRPLLFDRTFVIIQRKKGDRQMFEEKSAIEVITLKTEIKVVGWSMAKCVELGLIAEKDWMAMYGFFGKPGSREEEWARIKNRKQPAVNYAVWTSDGNLIIGTEVTDFAGQDEFFGCTTILPGDFVKVSWNGKDFDDLVENAMATVNDRVGLDAFVKENNIKTGQYIEVYPQEDIKKQYPECYTLRAVVRD